MKQLLVALCLSLISFAFISLILQNELVAGLVAIVVLFFVFFCLCLLAAAHFNEDQDYSDKQKPVSKKAAP